MKINIYFLLMKGQFYLQYSHFNCSFADFNGSVREKWKRLLIAFNFFFLFLIAKKLLLLFIKSKKNVKVIVTKIIMPSPFFLGFPGNKNFCKKINLNRLKQNFAKKKQKNLHCSRANKMQKNFAKQFTFFAWKSYFCLPIHFKCNGLAFLN